MNSQARAGPEDAGLSLGGTQASKQGSSLGPSTALTSVDAQQEAHHLPQEPPYLPDFEPKAYCRASPITVVIKLPFGGAAESQDGSGGKDRVVLSGPSQVS